MSTILTESGVDWEEYIASVTDEMTDVQSSSGSEASLRSSSIPTVGRASSKRRSLVPVERTKEDEAGDSAILYTNPMFLGFLSVGGLGVVFVLVFVKLFSEMGEYQDVLQRHASAHACAALGQLANSIVAELQSAVDSTPDIVVSNRTDTILISLGSAGFLGPGLPSLPSLLSEVVTEDFLSYIRYNITSETIPHAISQTGSVITNLLHLATSLQEVTNNAHHFTPSQYLLSLYHTELDLQSLLVGGATATTTHLHHHFRLYQQSCTMSTTAHGILSNMGVGFHGRLEPCLVEDQQYTSGVVDRVVLADAAKWDAMVVMLNEGAGDSAVEEEVMSGRKIASWISLSTGLLVVGLLCAIVVRAHGAASEYENHLRRDLSNAEGMTDTIDRYCRGMAEWNLDQQVISSSRVESHLWSAVKSLTYLRPFVPVWIFRWTAEEALPTTVFSPLNDAAQIDAHQLLASFNGGDNNGDTLSRKDSIASLCNLSISTGSKGTDATADDNNSPEVVYTRGVRHLDLTLGLRRTTKTLAMIYTGHVDVASTEVTPKQFEQGISVYYAVLHQMASACDATLLVVTPTHVTVDFEWSDSRPIEQKAAACSFVTKLLSTLKNKDTPTNTYCEAFSTSVRISLCHGSYHAGILSTGTFKTYIIAGRRYKMLVKMCRLAAYVEVTTLVDTGVRKSVSKTLDCSFTTWGIVCHEMVHKMCSIPEASESPSVKSDKKKKKPSPAQGPNVEATVKAFFKAFRAKKYTACAKQLRMYVQRYELGGRGGAAAPETPVLHHLYGVVMDHLGPNKDSIVEELSQYSSEGE